MREWMRSGRENINVHFGIARIAGELVFSYISCVSHWCGKASSQALDSYGRMRRFFNPTAVHRSPINDKRQLIAYTLLASMRRRWKIEDLQREESEILNFLCVVSARMSCHVVIVVMRLRLLCRFTTLFLFCNIIHRNSTSMKSAVCEIWEIYWNNFSPWLMNSSLCSAVDVCEAFFLHFSQSLSHIRNQFICTKVAASRENELIKV